METNMIGTSSNQNIRLSRFFWTQVPVNLFFFLRLLLRNLRVFIYLFIYCCLFHLVWFSFLFFFCQATMLKIRTVEQMPNITKWLTICIVKPWKQHKGRGFQIGHEQSWSRISALYFGSMHMQRGRKRSTFS